MQNSIDRQRLLRRYGHEPANPTTLIAKCLAGFLVLIGVLLIDLYVPDGGSGIRATTGDTAAVDVSASQSPSAAGGVPDCTPGPATGTPCGQETSGPVPTTTWHPAAMRD